MRINNVNIHTSAKSVVSLSIIIFILTVGFILVYINMSAAEISFFGFFRWLFVSFQSLREGMSDDPLVPWFILVGIISLYGCFFGAIISRHKALQLFKQDLNVKYINFLQGGMEVFYNQPRYNFSCAYSDVEKLNMDIESTLVKTKNNSYITFRQLNLEFNLFNGKKIKLSNTTSSPMSLIYKIIDYTRRVKSFSYDFSGYGEIPDYREKIDKYFKFGYKDLFAKEGESTLKSTSLTLFFIAVFLGFAISPSKSYYSFYFFIPSFVLILISFIFDIIFIVDKIRDNKYRGYNG